MNADYQLVKNLIRKMSDKHQQLDHDVVQSLRKWAAKLKAMGWHVFSQFITQPDNKVVVAFLCPWQKDQIRRHGNDLICIDSTHNTTKIVPQLGGKKLSTFNLLLRQPDTGRGLPVAWFLTTDETAYVQFRTQSSPNADIVYQLDNHHSTTVVKVKPQYASQGIPERLRQGHYQGDCRHLPYQSTTPRPFLVRSPCYQGSTT